MPETKLIATSTTKMKTNKESTDNARAGLGKTLMEAAQAGQGFSTEKPQEAAGIVNHYHFDGCIIAGRDAVSSGLSRADLNTILQHQSNTIDHLLRVIESQAEHIERLTELLAGKMITP